MNPLLAKFGKAFKTIQRDGFYRGGKRVAEAVAPLFRRVSPGDILIITGGVGDSARYRADHQAEELTFKGFHVEVIFQDNPFIHGCHRKFDIFIFHRVLYTSAVKRMIASIQKHQKTIIFDTDDLIFDKKYIQFMDYFKQMNVFEKKLYENGVGGEIVNDPSVRVCTVTTSFLAEQLRRRGKTVFISPNRLSRMDLQWAAEIIRMKKNKTQRAAVRLGYFSGTISHNKDFATIIDALATLMRRHAHLELFLAGPLDVSPAFLSAFAGRITTAPYVARKKYFESLAEIDINLVPLEIGNPFCEAKSELKFFEPGILGVPTVAVRNRTFSEALTDGVDGFLTSRTEEWIEKIEILLLNKTFRNKMGRLAHKTALENYTTLNASNDLYYRYLNSKIMQSLEY